jgi:hypothetical protein
LDAHKVARNYKPRSSDLIGTLLVTCYRSCSSAIWFFITAGARAKWVR